MIRLYLDKCVYSNIKSGKYNNLYDFLIQHQNKIIVPYSTATMLDLINYDHFNESAKEKLLDEFPYILSISKDHLLRFNEESNRVECYKEEIQEYLTLENIDYKPHEEFLKDSCNDSDVMSFWKVLQEFSKIKRLIYTTSFIKRSPKKKVICLMYSPKKV